MKDGKKVYFWDVKPKAYTLDLTDLNAPMGMKYFNDEDFKRLNDAVTHNAYLLASSVKYQKNLYKAGIWGILTGVVLLIGYIDHAKEIDKLEDRISKLEVKYGLLDGDDEEH